MAAQEKEGAMSSVWMHSEACSGQLLTVSGHDTKAEVGLDPPEAAVPVLPEARDGQGVLDHEQVAQLHHRQMR
jgi:hypothetical protein